MSLISKFFCFFFKIFFFLIIFLFFRDYGEFLDDLEEDPGLRQHINIYKDKTKLMPVDTNDMEDPSQPRITLEEMLDDLVLDDVEMTEME